MSSHLYKCNRSAFFLLSFIVYNGNRRAVFFDGIQNTGAVEVIPRYTKLRQLFAGKLRTVNAAENAGALAVLRQQAVAGSLAGSDAARILEQNGYDTGCCEHCVARLMKKLRKDGEFPHEIGLFLGYPPEDVQGFMELGPDCCKCTGCWKVYGDEAAAQRKFAQYKKCTRVYCDRWDKGADIERLAVNS